jgi:hypothetical protein
MACNVCASHGVPPGPGEREQATSMHVHRIAFRQSPQCAPFCTHQACMCIALRSPGSTRDVGSDVDEHHTMYASAPRCRRRWRAKYAAGRGAARVRIPAQTQRTQTQGASTRSACVHRAIPHSASIASSATASWRLWSGRRPRARRARRGAARVLMPVQVQCTRTQRASTRSACAHRAIPHIASSIIASWQAA